MAALIKALRPHHWAKQVFILASIAFIVRAQEWTTFLALGAVVVSWNLMASMGYLVNDLKDVERDKLHPIKRHRPIPSGQISIPVVVTTIVLAIVISLSLTFAVAEGALPVLLIYMGLTFVYNFKGKHIPIVDLAIVGSMYGLRVAAGFSVMQQPPHGWELWAVLASLLAFVIELGKRRSEVSTSEGKVETRPVLAFYQRGNILDNLFKVGVVSILALFMVAAVDLHPVMVLCGGLIAYALHRFWKANADVLHDTHPMHVIMKDGSIVASTAVFAVMFSTVVLFII